MSDPLWTKISNHLNGDVSFEINQTRVRAKITSVDTLQNGQQWVSFYILDHKELTPTLFGNHLGNFNSLYSPVNRRLIQGYCSDQVFDTLELCWPVHTRPFCLINACIEKMYVTRTGPVLSRLFAGSPCERGPAHLVVIHRNPPSRPCVRYTLRTKKGTSMRLCYPTALRSQSHLGHQNSCGLLPLEWGYFGWRDLSKNGVES